MASHPECVFLHHAECSQDRLWLHLNPTLDKALSENDEGKIPWQSELLMENMQWCSLFGQER